MSHCGRVCRCWCARGRMRWGCCRGRGGRRSWSVGRCRSGWRRHTGEPRSGGCWRTTGRRRYRRCWRRSRSGCSCQGRAGCKEERALSLRLEPTNIRVDGRRGRSKRGLFLCGRRLHHSRFDKFSGSDNSQDLRPRRQGTDLPRSEPHRVHAPDVGDKHSADYESHTHPSGWNPNPHAGSHGRSHPRGQPSQAEHRRRKPGRYSTAKIDCQPRNNEDDAHHPSAQAPY